MVARDDVSITVYAGPGDTRCKQLRQARAVVEREDDGQVVVAVTSRIVDTADCSTSGGAVPLMLTLRRPFDDRALRDAATGSSQLEHELTALRWT